MGKFYDNPDFTDGRNKGTIRFQLVRDDAQAYDTIIIGALVTSNRPNKTKTGVIVPLNINEKYALASAAGNAEGNPAPVYVPGYTRSESGRSLMISAL